MAAKTAVGELHGVITQETPDNLPAIVPVDANGDPSIGGLLRLAVEHLGGANPDAVVAAMERLVGMQERMDARKAVAQFNKSLATFQSECPPFKKGKLVDYTSKRTGARVKYRYGDIHEIREHITPYLSKNDLAVTWDITFESGKELSVCTVSHVDGHSRSGHFPILPDAGNEKSFRSNSQEFGSAETYAMRRSMISVLGMTGYDPDVDGAPQREELEQKISREQANEIAQLLADTLTSESRWCELYEVATVLELPASLYQKAVNQLNRKKAANANS